MEEQTTQQEVLLLTGTHFSARQYIENQDLNNSRRLDENEQLEEACWNGLLPVMLPEICTGTIQDKPVYIWKIREGKAFLEVEIGDVPGELEPYYSLDPYAYAHSRNYN